MHDWIAFIAACLISVGACARDAGPQAGAAVRSDAGPVAADGGTDGAGHAAAVAGAGGRAARAGTGGSTGSTGSRAGGASGSAGATTSAAGTGTGLAARYPGDVGLSTDPAVVWTEDFEESNVAALIARYDDAKSEGITFDRDTPAASGGKASGKLTATGSGPNAVDLFKLLSPGYDELFVRYYAKYEANVAWHHTGVWVGGYNPPSRWPNPQAGLRPNGDDRFSIALEPQEQGAAPRMDFYNYWMRMHSWMDSPMGATAYYGNSLIHEPTFTAKAEWQCFELHIRINSDVSSGAGAELGVWLNDRTIIQFSDSMPLGYWVKDKFCPSTAVGRDCTDYEPAAPMLVPLDLQFRSTAALKIDNFWPQNYITDAGAGSVWYDDMVVATQRIGCIE